MCLPGVEILKFKTLEAVSFHLLEKTACIFIGRNIFGIHNLVKWHSSFLMNVCNPEKLLCPHK